MHTDEITQIYEKVGREIEQNLQNLMMPPSNPLIAQLHQLLEAVVMARNSREVNSATMLLTNPLIGKNPLIAQWLEAVVMARNSREVNSATLLLTKVKLALPLLNHPPSLALDKDS